MGEAADDKSGIDGNQGGDAGGSKDDDENLLDDEAKNGGKSGDDDKGKDDDEGKGGGDDDAPLTASSLKPLLDDVVTKAVEAADRQADRRINQALDKIEKRLGGDDGGKGGKGGEDDAKGGGTSGPSADVVRSTRLAFKEYLDEGIQFLGNEERSFARDLGHSLIGGLTEIGDEDATGREVAEKVAAQVQAMRKFYETRTKAALKRRGLLKESDAGGKQHAASNTGGVGAGAEFDQGAAQAERMFGKKAPAGAGAQQ